MIDKEKLIQALTWAYCHKENENKPLDADLIKSMLKELERVLND